MATSERVRRLADGTAWREFCRALERTGLALLREGAPDDPLQRAEGLRYLTRLLRAGLESQLEYGDPRFPGFFQLSHETVKIGNDNPDNLYLNSNVSGAYEYRIRGTRGSVPYLSFGTKAGGYERDGTLAPTGHLHGRDLAVRPDGSFEIAVSCERGPGNWLPMRPETTQLIVRMTFHDREREEPARLRIERVGAEGAPRAGAEGAPRLDPETVEERLLRAVAFADRTANLFVDWMDLYAAHENALPSDDQERCMRAGGDAHIHYCQSRWRVAPDEALWIRIPRIPECASWNLQLSNHWMESLDYRYERIHVNKHTARPEPDGSVRIVVAHRDPGPRHPNWLSTAGHDRGGMLFRWVEAKEHPPIETRLVKLAELASMA
jgi:hypothetical protein